MSKIDKKLKSIENSFKNTLIAEYDEIMRFEKELKNFVQQTYNHTSKGLNYTGKAGAIKYAEKLAGRSLTENELKAFIDGVYSIGEHNFKYLGEYE